jgi:preprotein translocase SecE subunit
VYRELKKVEWTAPREVTRLTIVVLIVCTMVVSVLWLLSQAAGIIITALQGGK